MKIKNSVSIRHASILELLKIVDLVPECDACKHQRQREYEECINEKDPLILIALIDEYPAGFLVAYNKYSDGSYYCWRVGVLPQ